MLINWHLLLNRLYLRFPNAYSDFIFIKIYAFGAILDVKISPLCLF